MQERTRRIAKNTMVLYFRTFITMIVGIYTGRVMLEALGIDNYGIQNAVGSIIGFSSIITGAMTQAGSRYITYALGKDDLAGQRVVFATTMNAQIILTLICVVALESFGLWWLNCEANIPPGRMYAANWVFQASVITLAISLVSVPYGSCIVAHEKFSLYAYTSVVDVTLKLGIVFAILHYGGDRLILHSTLGVFVCLGMAVFYGIYSHTHFSEARYRPAVDKPLLKEMTQFSGWNMLNHSSWVMCTSGVSMLVNTFFGVAYNAARGVAGTVNGAVQSFVGTFTTAFVPQITKSYAAGDYSYCYTLVNRGIRYTWFLMYIFLVPVFVEAETLLNLWLVEVPPMAVLFLRFTMFESLALASGQSLLTLIQADGNVRKYTVCAAIYAGMIFPLVWLGYKLGGPVWITYPVFIVIFFTINILRLWILSENTTYDWRTYVRDVLRPCVPVSLLAFVLPLVISACWPPSLLRFFVLSLISVVNTVVIIYLIGLKPAERALLVDKARAVTLRVSGKLA